MTAAPARPARLAFTLIELLVVVAVIALLLAITLSAMPAVRESSRRAACLSNLRQLGVATQAVLDEQRDLPRAESTHISGQSAAEAPKSMLAVFADHLESPAVFLCPSDPDVRAWPPLDASLPYEAFEGRDPVGHHSSYVYSPGGLMDLVETMAPIPVPANAPNGDALRESFIRRQVTKWYDRTPRAPVFSDPFSWDGDTATPSVPTRHAGGPVLTTSSPTQFGRMWGAQAVTIGGSAGWSDWHVSELLRDFLGLPPDSPEVLP